MIKCIKNNNLYSIRKLCKSSGSGFVQALAVLIFIVGSGVPVEIAAANSKTGKRAEMTVEQAAAGEGAGCTLVILGASYAGAWGMDRIMGCGVINRGIDGNQSFEMLQRFDEDVLAEKPDYVLMWGFINDIFRSDPNKMDATIDRIRQSYERMVELSAQHNITPILATEVTIRPQAGFKNWIMGIIGKVLGKSSYQDFINGHVTRTNDWLRGFANENELRVLDFEKVLAAEDGSRDKAYAKDDGSHITPAAYQALTEYTRNTLN